MREGSDNVNQFIDDFYDVLFKPAKGMSRVADKRSVWHGLLVYLAISLISAMTAFGAVDSQTISEELSAFIPQQTAALLLQSWPVLNIIIILAFSPIILFTWSSILQFSSELLGGQGRGLSLAAVVGYAQMPYILLAPVGLISRYLPLDIMGVAGYIVLLWSLFLKIEGIRAAHNFSRRRAALAYFLPLLVLIAAVVILFLLLGSFLMPLLSQLYPMQ